MVVGGGWVYKWRTFLFALVVLPGLRQQFGEVRLSFQLGDASVHKASPTKQKSGVGKTSTSPHRAQISTQSNTAGLKQPDLVTIISINATSLNG